MSEWRLYGPLLAHWRERGYHAAASVTDPNGRRVELDVVAFTPDLEDVRIVEAKVRARGALLTQCLDRLALAPLVYAAVPEREAEHLLHLASEGDAAALGLLAVGPEGVRVLREAEPAGASPTRGPQAQLHRVLRGLLADGKA
ncbi:MAG TPA: hypothetical protein VNZ52_03735 [Candidatus Thermoplasmatota archaeon]|nr:hypothetical protein [Candidatus Thermoplasmatota archaeon]